MIKGTGTTWEFLDIVGSLKLYDRSHQTRGSQPKYIAQDYVYSLMFDLKRTSKCLGRKMQIRYGPMTNVDRGRDLLQTNDKCRQRSRFAMGQ